METPASIPCCYEPAPGVVLREDRWIGGLLFLPRPRRFLVLNETALVIWKTCAEGRDPRSVVAELHEVFDVDPAREIWPEVRSLVHLLETEGFLAPTAGP